MQVFVRTTCYLFDMLQIKDEILQELRGMLEDINIKKVFHDCRQDSAALFYQYGIKLRNVWDTQVDMMTVLLCIASFLALALSSADIC